jgi:hypothetical protein
MAPVDSASVVPALEAPAEPRLAARLRPETAARVVPAVRQARGFPVTPLLATVEMPTRVLLANGAATPPPPQTVATAARQPAARPILAMAELVAPVAPAEMPRPAQVPQSAALARVETELVETARAATAVTQAARRTAD